MQAAREAEVENLDQAAVGEHDVLRLEVAMKDAQRVRGLETVGDLNADREHQLEAGRAARDERVERLAGHELHDDVGFFAGFADLVDGADVGVFDRRGQPRLAQHRRPHLPCVSRPRRRILSTTGRVSSVSLARYTTPLPPAPRRRRIS
jgi:hypothetical protein